MPEKKEKDAQSCQIETSQKEFFQMYDTTENEVLQRLTPKKVSSRKLSDVYLELYKPGTSFANRAARVASCGDFLEYHVSKNGSRLAAANFCKDRLCPMCNWRRSLKVFGQMSQVMDELQNRGFVFLFLTLTVKSCSGDDLGCVLDEMQKGWREMQRISCFKKSVCGSFRSIEVTRNSKTGEYHPHYHIVLAVRPSYFTTGYLKTSQWGEMWRACCNLRYQPIINIKRIKEDSRGLKKAVCETAKYAVKDTDYLNGTWEERSAHVRTLLAGLTQRKLCSWTGVFYEVVKLLHLDDAENGDLLNVGDKLRDDLQYMVVRYHWAFGAYITGEVFPVTVQQSDTCDGDASAV